MRQWWNGDAAALPEADRAARSTQALFERGLVPVERSGWTMPRGVHAPYPQLEADLAAEVLVVGVGSTPSGKIFSPPLLMQVEPDPVAPDDAAHGKARRDPPGPIIQFAIG